jgi:hypothetical protein
MAMHARVSTILVVLAAGLAVLAPAPVQAQQACVTNLGACPMAMPGVPGETCFCPTIMGPVWGRILVAPSESRRPAPRPIPIEDVRDDEERPAPPPVRRRERVEGPATSKSECDARKYPDLCR